MPIPGPRTQLGPDPGYRNPNGEIPDFFNHWNQPGPVVWPGETPGTMQVSLRGNVLAAGQIRTMWRQAIDYIAAQAPFSTTTSSNPSAGSANGYMITRALRYMTRCIYEGAGIDHSRFDGMHSKIANDTKYVTITYGAGNTPSRPTIRNRMSSFGSRVPTLNTVVPAAENQNTGS